MAPEDLDDARTIVEGRENGVGAVQERPTAYQCFKRLFKRIEGDEWTEGDHSETLQSTDGPTKLFKTHLNQEVAIVPDITFSPLFHACWENLMPHMPQKSYKEDED